MDWNKWSGFTGSGVYAILNKASMTSLKLAEGSGTLAHGFAHCPNDMAQLWIIYKTNGKDLYAIQNIHTKTFLMATDPQAIVVGSMSMEKPGIATLGDRIPKLPAKALWVIDSGMCCLEPGKMVIIRNLNYPGFVVDLDHGKETNGTPVHLRPERGNNHDVGREMQKWLLQIQK